MMNRLNVFKNSWKIKIAFTSEQKFKGENLEFFQLAFRSVTNSISSKRDQIRRILQLPPPNIQMNDEPTQKSTNEDSHNNINEDSTILEPAVKDLEEAVVAYLRRATETFDLSKNVEVCSQKLTKNAKNEKFCNIAKLTSLNSPNFNIPKLTSPNLPNYKIPKLTSPNFQDSVAGFT